MSNEVPSEAELRRRIEEHIARRPDDHDVRVVWQGYLAALVEWDIISIDAHARLVGLLGGAGADTVRDLLLGFEEAPTP